VAEKLQEVSAKILIKVSCQHDAPADLLDRWLRRSSRLCCGEF